MAHRVTYCVAVTCPELDETGRDQPTAMVTRLTHKRHSLRWIVARHNGHRPNFADRHRYAVISLAQRMEAAVAAKGPNSAKSQSCGTISGRWEELRATYPKRKPPRGPVTAITK
jgi:hypothetical protein